MRSVACLHFSLKILTMVAAILSYRINGNISPCYFFGTIFFIATLIVAFAKPYRRPYMNYAEALLLSLMTLLCYTQSLGAVTMFETERILLASPIAVITLIRVVKICDTTMHELKLNLRLSFLQKLYNCFKARGASSTAEPRLGSSVDTLPETQPLIPPTSTVVA